MLHREWRELSVGGIYRSFRYFLFRLWGVAGLKSRAPKCQGLLDGWVGRDFRLRSYGASPRQESPVLRLRGVWVGDFFGVDFADDLDGRYNVEVYAAFFEGAALPEALFCVGFYPAGDELLPAGDVDADVVAWMGGEVVLHG